MSSINSGPLSFDALGTIFGITKPIKASDILLKKPGATKPYRLSDMYGVSNGAKSRYIAFSQVSPIPIGSYNSAWNDVTWVSSLNLFVVVSQTSAGNANKDAILTSPDGVTWTRRNMPFASNNDLMNRIESYSTRIFTSGNISNRTYTSTDGTTYTNQTNVASQQGCLAYSPTLNMWIVCGFNVVYYTTNNGTSWSNVAVTINPANCLWSSGAGAFFIFPRGQNFILKSTNGTTWTTISSVLNSAYSYYAIGYSSTLNTIMAIADSVSLVYTSTDNGVTWNAVLSGGTNELLFYSGGTCSLYWSSDLYCWIVTGVSGTCISETGVYWSRIHSSASVPSNPTIGIDYSSSLDKFIVAKSNIYISDSAKCGSIAFNTDNYITFADSTDFQFGTNAFTFEWFHKQTSNTNTQRIISYGTMFIIQITSANNLEVILNNVTVYSQTLPSYTLSTWYHFAVTRSSSVLRVFFDGTQLGSNVSNSTNITSSGTVLCIGNESTPVSNSSFIGKITNIHIMKTYAKYTSNFTKPTREIQYLFPNVGNSVLFLPCTTTRFLTDVTTYNKTATNNNCTSSTDSPFSV